MSKGLAEARRTHQWRGNEGDNDHGGKQRSTLFVDGWNLAKQRHMFLN